MTEEQAVAIRPKADAPAEWGKRDEIAALGKRIKTMLPGGDKMSDGQATAFAQYCKLTDVNPFRGESYAYVDWKGNLVIVDGYKALTRWARERCPYVEKYEPLEPAPGIAFGFRCWILRDDRKAEIAQWVEMGAPWRDAFEMVAVFADGVVRETELTIQHGKNQGKPADPPTGWTWEQVARKRSLKNALNLSHGAPSPQEMAKLSWQTENGVTTIPDDWDGAEELPSPQEAERLAELRAQGREHKTAWDQMTADEQQAKAKANSAILHGDHDEDDPFGIDVDIVTGEIIELPDVGPDWDTVPEQEEEPLSRPSKNKGAEVKTKNWTRAAEAVAADHPHYMSGDHVNFYHMTRAAFKEGYPEITDDNLAEVCTKLRLRVQEKEAEQAEMEID